MFFTILPDERRVLEIVGQCARKMDVPAYVVGGYVRDRLLGRPTKDIDIVCVGDGIKLAEAVAGRLSPRPKVAVYSRFGTAMLRADGIEYEFVGARRESYSPDSRKPEVELGTLEDDQNRRDFTINALAMSLSETDFGHIIDPFNGLEHLEHKIIKTPLDPGQTFSDDPLRCSAPSVSRINWILKLSLPLLKELPNTKAAYTSFPRSGSLGNWRKF